MQQSKFSLADVLALIAALLFSFVCFLGMNFYTLGDVSASLTTAGIIFALLFGADFGDTLPAISVIPCHFFLAVRCLFDLTKLQTFF
jgi:hypothetical protein